MSDVLERMLALILAQAQFRHLSLEPSGVDLALAQR